MNEELKDNLRIGALKKLGKVDGKEEFLLDELSIDEFSSAFLIPDNVSINDFSSREVYFITGFRGTGKTSLLRYVLISIQSNPDLRSIVLFKSDIEEEKKMQISNHVGADILSADSGKMGIAQDFKSAWMWFILHHIATALKKSDGIYVKNASSDRFMRIMGMHSESPYRKILGYLPKLEGSKVRISADIPFFSGELNLDFEKEGSKSATVIFSELVSCALDSLLLVSFQETLAIGVDELEVFFHNREQYDRDLSMVRDLIFCIDRVNGRFRSKKIPIYVVAAVRREIVDAIGTLGQEVNRVVHDRGISLAWHHAPKSLDHPLLEMVRKKIRRSLTDSYNGDPILDFFDTHVDGETIDTFLLDRSFYRPRDLMWRLTFAQKSFPMESKFGAKSLIGTETDYSTQLWNEVEYELSASFSPDEVSAISSIFSGIKRLFFLKDLEKLAEDKARHSKNVENFIKMHALSDVCEILYSHGAIGNDFRTGTTASISRHRWVFRGDPKLISDQRMTINPALRKALAAIDQRKRGTAGGRLRPRA